MRSMVEGASAAPLSDREPGVTNTTIAAAAAPSTACSGPPPPLRG